MGEERSRGVTAADLAAELEADPEWVARRDAAERERLERERQLTEASQPLLQDLRDVGYDVADVYLLQKPYARALPVLAAHLDRDYPEVIRAGIAHKLAVRGGEFAWDRLMAQYRATDIAELHQFKSALASTLARLATAKRLDELRELLADRSHGDSRLMLYRGFMRLKAPDRWELVEAGLADPDLRRQAEHLLKQKARRERA
jgi:hypothetical protein